MASLVCGMPCGMPCVTKPAFRLLVSPRRGNTLFAQHNTNPLHRVGVTGRLSHCNAHVAGSSHSMMHTQPMKTSKFLGQDLAAAHVGRCSNGATRHRVIRYTAKVSEPAMFGHCCPSTVLGRKQHKWSHLCFLGTASCNQCWAPFAQGCSTQLPSV